MSNAARSSSEGRSAKPKARMAAMLAATLFVCTLLTFAPAQVLLAQQDPSRNELLHYPGTSFRGLATAEARRSLEGCRKLCAERQGCAGFDHQANTNQCRLFAVIEFASQDPASNAGARYRIVGYNSPASSQGDLQSELRYDPIGNVTAFYSALSAADGVSASALVVPEKRGKGSFNEASIHSFFRAMSQRLTLTAVALRNTGEVRVTYEYVTQEGRQCRGRADVTTVFRSGKTFISRIKALDGC